MLHHRVRPLQPAAVDFDAIRAELGIAVDLPVDAEAEADALALLDVGPREDATDLPLVTVDPPGARDLDQAIAIEARGSGWRVHYAIADVGAWVRPGGAIDGAARARTQTYYAPDRRVPLHPHRLGEDLGSLLEGQDRPAALWTLDIDDAGTTTDLRVRRATVRSRAQLTYAGVQDLIDQGRAPEPLAAFAPLGEALLAAARARGAIELGLPEQEVVCDDDGTWTVVLRPDLPVEQWNAQVSLATGRAAAWLMLEAGVGLLRTVPTPDPATFPRLRAVARNLGIDWPEGTHPGTVLAEVDTTTAEGAAFADTAAELLRGAAYTPVAGPPPADPGHAGVGSPYAHVTAPLRRLVDRFGTEVCLAVAADRPVATWATEALAELPDLMADGDRRAKALDRAVVDATEAFVLAHRVGDTFDAAVIETGERHGTVVLADPPVRARCDGRGLPLGETIGVRCAEADVATRTVRFERVR